MSTTHTEIIMLLDRSGSMASIADDMIGGFNAFIAEQRSQGTDASVSLYQFDDRFTEVYVGKPIAEVGPLELHPRGMTALLDAIGRSVSETRARIAAKPAGERPGAVIFGIITDGLENASRELKHADVKKIIERQEAAEDWTFMYLGANQDAIEVGAGLGISRERSMTYDPRNVDAAMDAFAGSVSMLREHVAAGAPMVDARVAAAYSDEDRMAAMAGKRAKKPTGRPAR
ncbi:VWA domain-containing protein [Zafaria sp. Z1313]|uniref:VWA domain-containing protein n=1 Tax=Zafaria sp. Z1313 TaxID=3423202 RepID=UPI003D30220E